MSFNRFDLKPDWKISEILLRFRKNCSWSNTIFSKTFEINGKTEMGRKLFRIEGSSEGFLRSGVTVATLRVAGTEPVKRHLLKKDTKPGLTCVSAINKKKSRMYDVIRTKRWFNISNDVFEMPRKRRGFNVERTDFGS